MKKRCVQKNYFPIKKIYEKYLELKAKLGTNEITAEQAYEEGSKLRLSQEPA